jgi:hypothetical protein
MTHVKHLGWDAELKVVQISRALYFSTPDDRAVVLAHLKPVAMSRAVEDVLGRVSAARGGDAA